MPMNKFHKDRIAKKIKCYYKKSKHENCYAFILEDNLGIVIGGKKDKYTMVVSDEKQIFDLPTEKKMKKIPFKVCMKNVVSMSAKIQSAKFPVEIYGFAQIFLEAFTKESMMVKYKKSTMPPIQCKGG